MKKSFATIFTGTSSSFGVALCSKDTKYPEDAYPAQVSGNSAAIPPVDGDINRGDIKGISFPATGVWPIANQQMALSSVLPHKCITIMLFSLLMACANSDRPDKSRSTCGPELPTSYLSGYKKIMEEMHWNMDQVTLDADDRINYLKQMIPHHEGAIKMSELIIKSTNDRKIINIAQGIITEQRNEIEVMDYLIRLLESDQTNKIP